MHSFLKFSLFLAFFGSSCTLTPPYTPPKMDIPLEWHTEPSDGMECEVAECFVWWKSLNDPTLNSLMERAAFQNLDLSIAGTRILEARAARRGKDADLLPHVDASLNYGHLTCHSNRLIHDIVKTCNPCKKRHRSLNLNLFEVGFDVDWEIDLFGVRKYELNAMDARTDASYESFSQVFVTLSAEIARNYVELRGLQLRLELIRNTIEAQKESLQLTEDLLDIGMSNTVDTAQAEGQYSTLAAEKPLIQLAIQKTIHRLSILLGHPPGELFAELSIPQELPLLPCDRPIGIPSDLLRRRPDIKIAERNLAAAYEGIGSAMAALFPRLSLRGFVGDITTHLNTLCNPAKSGTWFAGPQLLMPLFNSHLIKQDVNFNKIKTKQALFEYQKTVLGALEETENAIASFHAELERNHYLLHAQDSAQRAYGLIFDLYKNGFKGYMEVLLAQRTLFTAQNAYIQSQMDLLMHYIVLYKSLGGGWDVCCADQIE